VERCLHAERPPGFEPAEDQLAPVAARRENLDGALEEDI
jgi:hypothetical protein